MPVEFDEQNTVTPSAQSPHPLEERMNQSQVPRGIIGWLIKKGVIKSETQGSIILLLVAFICFGLMFFFLYTYVL